MRIWFRLAVFIMCVLFTMPAMAEDPTLEDRVKRLEKGSRIGRQGKTRTGGHAAGDGEAGSHRTLFPKAQRTFR